MKSCGRRSGRRLLQEVGVAIGPRMVTAEEKWNRIGIAGAKARIIGARAKTIEVEAKMAIAEARRRSLAETRGRKRARTRKARVILMVIVIAIAVATRTWRKGIAELVKWR